jgi:2-polyprenyl-3-methyl-5-hydroxy-6-metoxy-1,4-benzoquinol methylase
LKDTIHDLAEPSVTQGRVQAAHLGGGISSDAIYSRIEQLIKVKGLRGSVLDYGAGVGNLTRRLLALQRFDRIAAVDVMRVPQDLNGSVEWTEQDLNIALPDWGEKFDVVIASEVIEHLENPRHAIRGIFRVLRPDGAIVISTPNNESWRSMGALLVRGHHVAFSDSCYPAHITALLRKDLERILHEAAFSRPEFYFTNEGGVPAHPSVTWQKISFGLLRGLRFSDNLLAVAKKPGIRL